MSIYPHFVKALFEWLHYCLTITIIVLYCHHALDLRQLRTWTTKLSPKSENAKLACYIQSNVNHVRVSLKQHHQTYCEVRLPLKPFLLEDFTYNKVSFLKWDTIYNLFCVKLSILSSVQHLTCSVSVCRETQQTKLL